MRPIRAQLIAPVLRHQQLSVFDESKTFSIADSRSVPLKRGKGLVYFFRVITPDAAARLKFSAWVQARRPRRSVLRLAGIGCAGNVDIHRAIGSDDEWVHRMVAAQRPS